MSTAMWNLNKAGPCTQPPIPVTPMVNMPFLHSSISVAGTKIPTVSHTYWRELLGLLYPLDAPTSSLAEQASLPSLYKYCPTEQEPGPGDRQAMFL